MKNHTAQSSSRPANTSKEEPDFDDYLKVIETQSNKVRSEIEAYWSALKVLPMAAMLIYCIQKAESNGPASDFLYSVGINRLWAARLLPIANKEKARPMGDFHSDEHIGFIEDIRCVKEWSYLEKEDLVGCYIKFSYDLARFTFGMFHPAFDPDRVRVERKVIKYELFMDFVQRLSERDALMAKLLYFGAPSVESVISLKIADLEIEKLEIKFGERVVRFPKHLMKGIEEYVQTRKDNAKNLVFVNMRGEQVDRVHLDQTFARASGKTPEVTKITPASLLR